jgi:nicotinamide-nucleotide amidase
MPTRVEIIAIGKELLRGQTEDTNSSWLAKRITALGGVVGRICIPDDDVAAIVQEIKASFANGARLIITTGIAEAIGSPLALHPGALEFVTRRYQDFYEKGFVDDPQITPAREKMAYLPQGSEPLTNPVGTAPAVFLKTPGGVIFALPGVPKEMQAIFEQIVLPRLKELFGAAVYLEETINTGVRDESALAGISEQVMRKVPGTYLKSKAAGFSQAMGLEVVITAVGSDQQVLQKKVREAKGILLKLVKALPTRTAG